MFKRILISIARAILTTPKAICRPCWERAGKKPDALLYAGPRTLATCELCGIVKSEREVVWVDGGLLK